MSLFYLFNTRGLYIYYIHLSSKYNFMRLKRLEYDSENCFK